MSAAPSGTLSPNPALPERNLGRDSNPWHDATLDGALTDPAGNASTPAQIRAGLDALPDIAQAASGAADSAAAASAAVGNHAAQTTAAHGGIVSTTDPRLSDARAPTAHNHDDAYDATGSAAAARAAHEAAHNHTLLHAHNNATALASLTPIIAGKMLVVNPSGTGYEEEDVPASGATREYNAMSCATVGTGWAVTAPAYIDTVGGDIVRVFDDATERGIGIGEMLIGAGKTQLTLTIIWAAGTAPSTTESIAVKLYTKKYAAAWDSGIVLNSLSCADANPHTFSQTISLATLGLSAGDCVQCEITRAVGDAADTLVGNAHVALIRIEVS